MVDELLRLFCVFVYILILVIRLIFSFIVTFQNSRQELSSTTFFGGGALGRSTGFSVGATSGSFTGFSGGDNPTILPRAVAGSRAI